MLESVRYDLGDISLVAVLVIPASCAQPSFYVKLCPFPYIFLDNIGGVPPGDYTVPFGDLPGFTAVSVPLFGAMVDKVGKATIWMITGAVMVMSAHIIMAFAPQGTAFYGYLAISLLGIGYSLVPSAMWPSVPKIIPERNLGTAYSLIYWIQNMGMLLVPIFVGRIFNLTVTEAGNRAQEIAAAVSAEYIFIGLGAAAIITACLLIFSSRHHPELEIDMPNSKRNV